MNIRQKQILSTTSFLFVLFILFPPWLYENAQTSVEYRAGYHFLFSPPTIKPDIEMRKQLSISDNVPILFSVRRDELRFTSEIIAIIFFTVGLLLVFADKKSPVGNVVGSISIVIGSLFAVLVFLLSWR